MTKLPSGRLEGLKLPLDVRYRSVTRSRHIVATHEGEHADHRRAANEPTDSHTAPP